MIFGEESDFDPGEIPFCILHSPTFELSESSCKTSNVCDNFDVSYPTIIDQPVNKSILNSSPGNASKNQLDQGTHKPQENVLEATSHVIFHQETHDARYSLNKIKKVVASRTVNI